MSTSNKTGAGRRLRIAGLALFALAMIAVLVGLVVAVTRGEQTAATEQPPVTPAHAPGSASAGPSVIPYPPPATSDPAEAPAVSPPGPPDAAEGAPASGRGPRGEGPRDQGRRGEVRVYNNSTIRGLAARAARDLSAAGWTVVEVGNYARGTIPTTTAYYQEGTDLQASAEALGAEFGMRVEPRFPGIANAGPGLIVIVTNDYSR
jgi:hypothetical protein